MYYIAKNQKKKRLQKLYIINKFFFYFSDKKTLELYNERSFIGLLLVVNIESMYYIAKNQKKKKITKNCTN